jgi:hypothetical protein
MLDRIDSRRNGISQALRAEYVGRNPATQSMGLVDAGCEFGHAVLGRGRVAPGCQHSTRRHHLDEIDALLAENARRLAHLELAVGPFAHEVAMAILRRDRPSRDEQSRSYDQPGADCVTQCQGNGSGAAAVAQRGHARLKRETGVPLRTHQKLAFGRRSHVVGHVLRHHVRRHCKMNVAVDQSGKNRAPGEGHRGAKVSATSSRRCLHERKASVAHANFGSLARGRAGTVDKEIRGNSDIVAHFAVSAAAQAAIHCEDVEV